MQFKTSNMNTQHSLMQMAKTITSLIIVCWSAMVCAQSDSMMVVDRIQTDRPDQTETSALVPKGYFQMEHGFSIEDTDPGFIYTMPSSLWKYGLNEHFEIRVITEFVRIQKEPNPDIDGFLPVKVGFKSKLGEQKGILPQVAFIGHLAFPGIVSDEFETIYFAPDLRLAMSHTISDFFSVGYNVGIEWSNDNAEPDFFYSLAPNFSLTKRLGLFIEGYGYTPQREDDPIELRADAGLTYLIGNNFLLDVSAGQGISEAAIERFISFGFSYRFKI